MTPVIISIAAAAAFGFVCYVYGHDKGHKKGVTNGTKFAVDYTLKTIRHDHLIVCKNGCDECRATLKDHWNNDAS